MDAQRPVTIGATVWLREQRIAQEVVVTYLVVHYRLWNTAR
jgi:hypothetical protein